MNILLPGLYPRSEKLVAASRDLDRLRIKPEEYSKIVKDDADQYRQLQSGLAFKAPSLAAWQDLIRPFTELFGNARAESLTRFYETNTFWRILESEGDPAILEDRMDAWIEKWFFEEGNVGKDESLVFTLPFLFVFKDFSKGISPAHIYKVLSKVAAKLLEKPNRILCFYEPTFGWRSLSQEEKILGQKLIEEIKANSSGTLYIYNSFFVIDRDWEFIYSLPADGFGFDFYANSIANVMTRFPQNKHLLAGIINTESTLIESRTVIENFLSSLKEHISEQNIFFIPNGPSELLPRSVMDKKIKNLQEIILCQPQPF